MTPHPFARASNPVQDAYEACEAITREQARNFYYGIRLLARDRRAMLCAVYALARRVDDIGDGDLPEASKQAQLEQVRAEVQAIRDWSRESSGPAPLSEAPLSKAPLSEAALSGALPPGSSSPGSSGAARRVPTAGVSVDPVLLAVADACTRLPIPLDAFDELVDGVEMDVAHRTYETFDELVDYCRCVAGSIGRLCLAVFGSRPDPAAASYANSLGIALQQTNILRDIREDLMNGRIYLPAKDLESFGVELALDDAGRLADPDGHLAELIRYSCRRARQWYDEGLRLIPLLDKRSAASASAMAGIYAALLEQIEADPTRVYDRRLSLTGRQKAVVALRSLRASWRSRKDRIAAGDVA